MAPQITSITGNGTFSAGVPNFVRLSVTGTPTPTLGLTGTLPAWASVDLATGIISGTPPIGTDNSWPLVATATNSAGSVSQNFVLHGRPAMAQVTGFSSRISVTSNGAFVTFAIAGGNRTVLLRGVGPGLTQFSVSGAMTDPQIQLSEASSGTLLQANDNWNSADAATIAEAGAFPLTSGSRDSALVATLAPGVYRAKISGVGQTTGMVLVELYDVTDVSANTSHLTYLALHGQSTSATPMGVNVFVRGTDSNLVVMRAVGRANGSDAALLDSTMIAYNSASQLAGINWNWDDYGNVARNRQYEARLGATPLVAGSLDSMVDIPLSAGSYLVYASANSGQGGAVLFELFPSAIRDLVRPPLIEIASSTQTIMGGVASTLAPTISGTALTYQWRKNTVPIPGETKATLTFANPTVADQGTYDLVATNVTATATSQPITLSVITPVLPTIVSQPVSGEFYSGDTVKFSVVCSGGTAPISYQWRKNGVPISGATNADHIFRAAGLGYDVGAYDVVITNPAGSITSERATLAMGQLPFTASPAPQYVRFGDPVTLGAHPTSNITISHSWYKDNVPVSRPAMGYNLEGVAMGEIAAGQPVPAGRWTTPGGGGLYLAGIIGVQEGQIVGAGNNRTYVIPSIAGTDLAPYSVDVTINSATERRGPAAVALRGTGSLGRRFLAVGSNGNILRSYEGETWTSSVSGVSTELRGVALKGDAAVAVGAAGTILRSLNLDTWTRSRNTTVDDLNAVVAGPDRFVAVGAGGRVLVSTDGVDWYHGRHITHATLTGVTYGNGLYVMTGANGAVFVSVDGFNWFNRNSQTTSGLAFVTFAGNQFWALGGGYLISSPDGLTWNRVDATQPVWFRSLAYDGASLVAVGTGGRVYTSGNGIAWTLRTSGTTSDLLAVAWSGTEVPGGFTPTSVLSDMDFRILMPPYAVTATVGQPATFSVSTTGHPTSYQWYKGGTPINNANAPAYTIPSVQLGDVGGYWVKITSAAGEITSSTAGLQLRGGGTLGSQFIAVGENGVILTSPDGLTFTERLNDSGRVWRAVAASAHLAVAVGKGNIVGTSTDGVTWITRGLPLPGARILRGVAAGVSQFVAVGSAGTIIVTFDGGDSWKLVQSGTTQSLWSVAWDGTNFVAVGEGGIVLTSSDGLTWSPGTSPTSQRLYAIQANGSKLVAVTELGAAYETNNGGASWSAVGVSGDLWARSVAVASSGRRVIVGDRGMISTSAGGSVWNLAASPTASRLYGVTWTGALGTVSGDLSTAIQAPSLRILSQPQAVAGFVGGTASFSVTAGGVGPYEYQWLKNGVELSQQTQSTLFLANLQSADAGSYSVEVRNAQGVVTSATAALTVSIGSGSAPTLASSPASRSVSVGSATNFVVAADGQAPFTYRWYFNGNPISGAVSATLALSNVQMANAGSYTVMVSNRYGSVTSAPAALTVTSVPGMPVISQQPASQAVAANGVAIFTVVATGTPAPAYQWRKDGVDINNATQATLTVDPVQIANAGVYTVRVSNSVGEVISEPASLTVVPAGTTATHRQTAGRGYEAGGTVTITSTLTFVGQAQSAGWEVLLPAGWSYVSGGGAQGDIRPIAGETQLLSWAWTTPPASPITFTYTLQVPGGTTGTQALAALAVLRQGGVPIRLMAQPDPLIIAPASTLHAADTSGDQRIDLVELTRVIELFNTRNGSVRTGAYRVDAGGEDGFATDATRGVNSSASLARYHSADTRNSSSSAVPDGAIDLLELTRVIEIYNQRAGSVRTGQYRVQSGTEDGFAPAP